MEGTKIVFKNNEWLLDKSIAQELCTKYLFDDKYITKLFKMVYNYLIKLPIPVVSAIQGKQIILKIGQYKIYITIDMDISQHDFINLINNRLKSFFPSWEEDIVDEDNTTKKTIKYIKEIDLKKDIFIVASYNGDNKNDVYQSGTLENPCPLSKFLKYIRKYKLKNDSLKCYIDLNSRYLHSETSLDHIISYPNPKWYINFFNINREVFFKNTLKKIGNLTYKVLNYTIIFPSEEVENICLNIYNKYKTIGDKNDYIEQFSGDSSKEKGNSSNAPIETPSNNQKSKKKRGTTKEKQ